MPQKLLIPNKVRAAVLTHYADLTKQLGANPVNLLREVGLRQAMLSHPDQKISAEAVVRLLEITAKETGCKSFGLQLSELHTLSDFGSISLLLTHQRTLRDVLRTLEEYRHILSDSLALNLEVSGKTCILREEVIANGAKQGKQAIEFALAVLNRMCRFILGNRWTPRCVNFTHAALAESWIYHKNFLCKVEFNSDFNGIVFDTELLDSSNPHADTALANYAKTFIDTLHGANVNATADYVRKMIYLLIPTGRISIEIIAENLSLSARTLQRHLVEEGSNFRDILNEVRKELVIRYMENKSYNLQRIAEQLGYANPSSFTRWFCSEFQQTPSAWRSVLEK